MPLTTIIVGSSSPLFRAAVAVASSSCRHHPPRAHHCLAALLAPSSRQHWSSAPPPPPMITISRQRVVQAQRCAPFASNAGGMVPPNGQQQPQQQQQQNGGGVGLWKRYEQWLQGSYPTIYKLHRLSIDGSKWCYSDLKTFFWLAYGLRKERITLHDLNAHELFIYIQCYAEVIRILVFNILLGIPICGELIILLAIASPKHVLTRHFWSDWQSQQFQTDDLRRNGRKLFPQIVEALRQHNPSTSPLDKLPLAVEQLVTQKAAVNIPSSLDSLTQGHRFYLKRMKNLPFWASDNALLRHIKLMQLLDARMAEQAQNNVDKLSMRDLQTHLYLRNLDYSRMTVEQMRSALVHWLSHFKNPSIDPLLYAHVPVLTQADSNDLDRWRKKRTDAEVKDASTLLPDNLEEWRKQMGQRSAELAKRSADAMKPMLRKGTQMVKDAGKAVKKAAN